MKQLTGPILLIIVAIIATIEAHFRWNPSERFPFYGDPHQHYKQDIHLDIGPSRGRRTRQDESLPEPSYVSSSCSSSEATAVSCALCVETECDTIIPYDYDRAKCALALSVPGSACILGHSNHLIVGCFQCFGKCEKQCNADRCSCCNNKNAGDCSVDNCGSCQNICDICKAKCPTSCPSEPCSACSTTKCSSACGAKH